MSGRRFRFDLRQAGRRIATALAVWAVANTVFYGLLVRPKVRESTQLLEGTGKEQEALRGQRAEVEERETYLAGLLRAEEDLRRLRQEVLATREQRQIDVNLELASLAGQFGIDVDSVTFENELLREEELDKLVMIVPLQGGYSSLRRFLQAVEGSDKFLVVERVALGEGKHGGVMLQLSISLATYFDGPLELKRVNELERRARRTTRQQEG